jgi:hypothetical protein
MPRFVPDDRLFRGMKPQITGTVTADYADYADFHAEKKSGSLSRKKKGRPLVGRPKNYFDGLNR